MTDEQIEQAERDATETAQALLLMVLIAPNVAFRPDVGRFYVDGRSVSITQIREYVRRIETRIGRRLTRLTNDLEAGRITLREWREGFERDITAAHVLTAALAVGGIAAAVRNPDVQSRIDSELGYASRFGREIADDEAGSHRRIASRAKSYLLATAVTYGILEQAVRRLLTRFTECRRVRRASESCEGCIAYSYRWMPIEEMPAIGSLQCGSRCRCYLEYR